MLTRVIRSPFTLFRFLYDWTVGWAGSRQAPWALFLVAFTESSFFPVPPDVLLIPMVVARQARWWRIALICTLGSLTGAVLGYYIGVALYETVGVRIVEFYDLEHLMEVVGERYQHDAFLAVFTAAFTPIPFKVFTIAGGVFKISLPMLLFGSLLGRAGRFFIVAGLLRLYGERIQRNIEKYFDILSIAFVVLLVGGFLLLKYVR